MVLQLSDYLSINRILFTTAPTKEEVIDELIALSREDGKVHEVRGFKEALMKRESIMSTGIGYGVAIPHVKLPGLDGFFITVGVHKTGVNWESLDCKPVYLIFLIAGPDNDQERYLRILARLTMVIKKPEQRRGILRLGTKYQVYEQLAEM